MQAVRKGGAVWMLAAFLATLLLIQHPAAAGESSGPVHSATKSDMLVISRENGERPSQPGGKGQTRSPAATDKRVYAPPGPAARNLVDVTISGEALWLNSFASRSMPLDGPACAALSDDIIARYQLPHSAVQRLAEEDLMRQMRVCAANGSLLVTCYGGSATVSLRRPQLGDGCSD